MIWDLGKGHCNKSIHVGGLDKSNANRPQPWASAWSHKLTIDSELTIPGPLPHGRGSEDSANKPFSGYSGGGGGGSGAGVSLGSGGLGAGVPRGGHPHPPKARNHPRRGASGPRYTLPWTAPSRSRLGRLCEQTVFGLLGRWWRRFGCGSIAGKRRTRGGSISGKAPAAG